MKSHQSYQSYAMRRMKRKRKNILRKTIQKTVFTLFICIFILGLSIVLTDDSVDAHNEETSARTKYYTSIEVAPGDSLWSIAEKYADENYETIHDYVDELKDINSLKSNKIQDGQYLTVSYYSL